MSSSAAQDAISLVAARHGLEPAFVRTFASDARDLDIDFRAPRAVIVTKILTACLGLAESYAWELPISARVLLLVGLSERSAPPIEVHFDCACGEQAELELTALELAEFSAARVQSSLELAESGVRLRLPTGRDQLRWTVLAASGDDHELARSVLSDLVLAGELTDALVPAVDRALAEADPLVELRLDTVCPACAAPLAKDVDLEAIGIARMRRQHRLLLEDVHVLASAYHWSEEQIVHMPAWRREEYRALLGRSRT